MKPLEKSGFSGGSAPSPIVCLGMKAWWDQPDASGDDGMFAIPFASTVAMELRRELRIGCGSDHAAQQLLMRNDADIDTEIRERFHNMQQAFLGIDADRDGRITKRELLAKCKAWHLSPKEAERVLGEADLDLDSKLSFEEFAKRFNSAFPEMQFSLSSDKVKEKRHFKDKDR
eukprot:gnl/TRDRNA2_/TRDRNA2_177699_c1_seq16.p1 gnl/TRDRNA2_/TRDRNA2_177699_c1~~gnl/TRDRNA2_/TRDRNA2_177699_c1_seq16.p1  ORF type:complete len:173 (+),score=44.25 gnl/TRDRNA2_/TRDRNA2_177699_c1_seq16:783-1301(+)